MANLVDIAPVMRRIESHVAATGFFPRVQIGEPKAMAINSVTTAALFFRDITVSQASLSGLVMTIRTWCRIYVPIPVQMPEPQEQIEFTLANGYLAILDSLGADVRLGDQVRNISFAGGVTGQGAGLGEVAGYLTIANVLCRVGDIAIDCVLDRENVFGYMAS